jgi:hypothetical protein
MKQARHALFDILGVLLILSSPLLGWLPGPGGVPLFLAGLGFLAVHHAWAKDMIRYVKNNGLKINDYIFREHPSLQALYDIASLGLLAGGIYLLTSYTRSLTLSIAIVCIFTALTLFLGNRKRLNTFLSRMKRRFKL